MQNLARINIQKESIPLTDIIYFFPFALGTKKKAELQRSNYYTVQQVFDSHRSEIKQQITIVLNPGFKRTLQQTELSRRLERKQLVSIFIDLNQFKNCKGINNKNLINIS